MKKPPHVIEIFLQPGEVYFGARDTRIRTLLGSCVAITLWHPQLLIGGMCHFMLPARVAKGGENLDGRYADEAMALLVREMRSAGTRPEQYHVKLFGGGNMFRVPERCEDSGSCQNVSCRNVMAARSLVAHYGQNVVAEHVGMQGHRNVIFDIWSGQVWMRHVSTSASVEKGQDGEQGECIHRR